MATHRANPFIWVTWLSSLISGDNPCLWQVWFRAHYQLDEEQPSDFDLISWKMDHTRMLSELADDLEQKPGALVRTEEGMKHLFEEYNVTISGNADCVCREQGCITVYDCKTGKKRDSDQVQVMLYMWLLSKNPMLKDETIRGEVVYTDERISVQKLPDNFEDNLIYYINLISRKKPLRKSPGNACKFCKITQNDCPDRED